MRPREMKTGTAGDEGDLDVARRRIDERIAMRVWQAVPRLSSKTCRRSSMAEGEYERAREVYATTAIFQPEGLAHERELIDARRLRRAVAHDLEIGADRARGDSLSIVTADVGESARESHRRGFSSARRPIRRPSESCWSTGRPAAARR